MAYFPDAHHDVAVGVHNALSSRKYGVKKEDPNTYVITGQGSHGLSTGAIQDILKRSAVTNYRWKTVVKKDDKGRQLVQLVPRTPQK
ncbi:MAG TPA: hypothetical protein VLE89_00445 [Chlamydiales bacterium]|nr:hypothetical protein [Chlamydiales bacterium]